MKLKEWTRQQTRKVLRRLVFAVFFILVPLFVAGLLWIQSRQLEEALVASEPALVLSLQTGDIHLLQKSIALFRSSEGLLSIAIDDVDGQTITAFERSERANFAFKKQSWIKDSSGKRWGVVNIRWEPEWNTLLTFAVVTVCVLLITSIVIFRAWYDSYELLVQSITAFSSEKPTSSQNLLQIEDISIVFRKLNDLKFREVEAERLLAQREKERAVITLSQKVAHDIRSPLSVVSLVLNSLELDDEKSSMIKLAIKRMNDICSGLLNEGKKLRDEGLLLNDAIVMAVSEVKVHHKDIAINLDLDPACSRSEIPDSEFQSILVNLIMNAVEAAQERKAQIRISTKLVADETSITITDNGNGIPLHLVGKLGNAPVTSTKSENGNGLGLYNASEWARRRNGRLQIISSSSEGSKISVSYKA
jgi:signal transduction histidine kinase